VELLGVGAALGVATAIALPSPAQACGGLFCSSSNPVNQAAEQILFVDNPDGTITAVIQIMYEGPAHEFAWVLPIPGEPEIAVSSDQALDALKQATNPLYQLTTTQSGSCGQSRGLSAPGAASFGNDDADSESGGVNVVASGAIGPYDYTVISFDPQLEDPADVAIEWLTDNAYDVGALGPDLLRPYLEEGLNLLAFKLTKGNDSGSIRPVMITYEAELPSIPIRPTAVAANDDMGILVWVLSDERSVPENYKSLELNEGLLDWFNPNNNYNAVVTAAADEAMGQGFVTEYAGKHADLGVAVFPEWQQQAWSDFMARQHPDPLQMVSEARGNWGMYDGFDDALREAVTLPDDLEFEDFKNCMQCYLSMQGVVFDTQLYLEKLFELTIEPMIATQELLESRPYMTRFYTTLSADEMTLDPVFAVNADLDDYSNVHTAEQVVECDSDAWTVNLPQGGSVRGFVAGTWPVTADDAPAARKIIQYGTEGQGVVVSDRTADIGRMLKARNQRTTQEAIANGTYEPDDGCAAVARGGSTGTASTWWLALGALLLVSRRRFAAARWRLARRRARRLAR
jgi:hypothetical protein